MYRRHVIVPRESGFFTCVNFAFDQDRHVTRILKVIDDCNGVYKSAEYHNAVALGYSLQPIEKLYTTEPLLNQIFDCQGRLVLKVVNEAIFDQNEYPEWVKMASDVGCVYDRQTQRLFYIPITQYCHALGNVHTLQMLRHYNYSCLSQIWFKSPYQDIRNCSMSFCTVDSLDPSVPSCIANFDLGTITTQEAINKDKLASRYLNLSFRITIHQAILQKYSFNIDMKETANEKTTYIEYVGNKLDINEMLLELTVEAYDCSTGKICEEAFGFLNIDTEYCFAQDTVCHIRDGKGQFNILVPAETAKRHIPIVYVSLFDDRRVKAILDLRNLI